jgi:hypothetical protein
MSSNQPTEDERRFLESQGLREVEPGRWLSDFEASDPETQHLADNMSAADREYIDLVMRAGRVTTEFDMEQSGEDSAVHVQTLSPDHEEHAEVGLAVFVAVRPDSAEAFDALDGETVEDGLNDMLDRFEVMPPPDALAATLRRLGIKCKTVEENPHYTGPEGPDRRFYAGFRLAVMHFPGGQRYWLDAT